MGEYIDIVNENDQVIGRRKEFGKEYPKDKITRSVAIFLMKDEKIILQKRSSKKFRYPEYWCVSVGGFVDSGEEYNQAIIREVKEELGVNLKIAECTKIIKIIIEDDMKHFVTLYKANLNQDITENKDEVKEVIYLTQQEIERIIKEKKEKVTPFCIKLFTEFKNSNNDQ
jgi:isopentenyldiphosphate isomerase